VTVQKPHTPIRAAAGQRLGKDPGIAAFVAGGVGAADNAVGKRLEGRLYRQQLGRAHDAPCHAIFAHQRGGVARGVKRLLLGVVMRDAALQAVVFDAGGLHHLLEGVMAVGAQRHQLLHIALKRCVIALPEELQAPAPLLPALAKRQLRAKQQRRIVTKHPFQRLQRRIPVGPGFAVADGNLRRIGKAGFQRRAGLPVNNRHLMAPLQQMPGGAYTNNSRAQNNDFHGYTFSDLQV
jgi:hypothetical protein